MTEAIRLVIWDLDETFWSGTLTEGGIHYQRAAHDIVIELTARGIMCAICSKNDFDAVREILMAEGIWDYFIFPSINWHPKGPRIAQLIEEVQLRPCNVLFIDDNPTNLNEALQRVPGIQVAGPALISNLLEDARLRGTDDVARTRLQHYKLLERRREDRQCRGDNLEFLRESNICVTIDNDVESQIDRAIELINRTNQLNFTKRRLSEDAETSRHQLRSELRERNTQAGLVRVSDRYGDYGIVGFYLLHVHSWRLIHFCFSCRTLGMGVERWLYERLRHPAIVVVGEVQADLFASQPRIDWINVADSKFTENNSHPRLGRVFIRGGCEMQSIAHYFALDAEHLHTEFPFDRGGFPIPIHHSMFLRAAIEGLSDRQKSTAAQLGYMSSDFESHIVTDPLPFDIYVFSFWADAHYALYRDREATLRLPFGLHGRNNGADLRQVRDEDLRDQLTEPGMRERIAALFEGFEYLSWSPGIEESSGKSLLEENLRIIFEACPPAARIYVLLGCEEVRNGDGQLEPVLHLKELNRITRHAAQGLPQVHVLAPADFVSTSADIIDATHFDRLVYYRIYKQIARLQVESEPPCRIVDRAAKGLANLQLFASTWGLNHQVLDNPDEWLRVAIDHDGDSSFSGRPETISIMDVGRFGNRFYQLLNASMIARRLGCREIRVSRVDGMGELPRVVRGIKFGKAGTQPHQATLRGVFFTYRGFERLVEPLDPWFIQDTIDNWVGPFFEIEQNSQPDNAIVLHFRAGDVFADNPDWVPHPYVMPPASFYYGAVEYARTQFGVCEVRIVYEDRGNPAIAAVEEYLARQRIPFQSQSGSLEHDSAILLGARHLAISYGTFGEATAMLSGRLRTLFTFRDVESHEWLYQREQSLLKVVLRYAKGVRTFVTIDRFGGYIPPMGWKRTAEQLALIRGYPADALEIQEVL